MITKNFNIIKLDSISVKIDINNRVGTEANNVRGRSNRVYAVMRDQM